MLSYDAESYSIYQLEMCAVSNLAGGCDILLYDYITPVLLTIQTATNKASVQLEPCTCTLQLARCLRTFHVDFEKIQNL